MSGDLDNLRELVAKLDEVQLDLEKVKSGLDKNFKNYKKVSDISTSISEKNKEVLESINTLHIEATTTVENAFEETIKLRETMSKYYSAENTKIKENFNALLSNMKSELITLKIDINRTIKEEYIDHSKPKTFFELKWYQREPSRTSDFFAIKLVVDDSKVVSLKRDKLS